jgi:glycosyltransferase involved in cell wall biosynthesis
MKRKIIFLAPTGQLGGAERCLVDALWSMQQDYPQFEKTLIIGSDGLLAEQARNEKTEVIILPFPQGFAAIGDSGLRRNPVNVIKLLIKMLLAGPAMLIYLFRLRREITRQKPDVVHVLGLKMQILSLLAVPKRVQIVWNVQDYISMRPMVRRVMKIAMKTHGRRRKISAGCCSEDVCKDLEIVFPDNEIKRIATVYNTIDTETFLPDLEKPAVVQGDSVIQIGLVATYARWKGQDLFIESLAKLDKAPALPAWHGWIIGGPIYATSASQWTRDELQELLNKNNLADKVSLLNFQANPASVMRGLDILVHASIKPEPFGRVIAESQACGCAVVAVNTGGSAEVFEENISGFGFTMGSASSLADVLQSLLKNPDRINMIRKSSLNFSRSRYDRRGLSNKWIQLYYLK